MSAFFQKHRPIFIVFGAIFVFLWLTNTLLPPLSDDFDAFYEAQKGFQSAKNMYLNWNARIGQLLFSGLVAGFAPPLFDFFNALMGTSFIFVFFALVFGKAPRFHHPFDFTALFLICLFILYCVSFGAVFLWGAGSTNYLWGILFIMLFLLPFRFFAEKTLGGVEIAGGGV